MDTVPSRMLLCLFMVALTAVFRGALTAVENVSEAKLSSRGEEGGKRAACLMRMLKNPGRFYDCMSCAIALTELILTAYASVYLAPALRFSHGWLARTVTVAVVWAVVMIFGEYLPRRTAAKKSEQLLFALFVPIVAGYCVFLPFATVFSAAASGLSRLFGVNPKEADDEVTEEEIRQMVDAGSESGAIDPEEKEMIHNIFELDDTPVESVMTHRTDVIFLWLEELEQWEGIIDESNHSVYPVCGEKVDDVIGLLYSRDFLRLLIKNRKITESEVKKILRQPYFVPESVKADDLFRKMQKNKTHFAVVLDEYGGLGGIISMSDLLEEIVGNLDSEYDEPEDEEITRLDANTWRIRGSADIDLVSDELETELPTEEYNTFAGMILGELGTIPEDGTTLELEAFGLEIKVTKIEEHRIEEALVCRTEPITEKEE